MITTTSDTKVHPPMVIPAPPKMLPSYRPRARQPDGTLTPTIPASGSDMSTVDNGMLSSQNGGVVKEHSHLRSEVKRVDSASFKIASDMLKLLATLPAPLPAVLPPKRLSIPNRSPIQTSFTEFANGSKRRMSSSEHSLVGLGLTLDPSKRHKQQLNDEFSGVVAQMGTRKLGGPSKASWIPSQWSEYGSHLSARAIRSKRYGDAYGVTAQARQEFLAKVSPDHTLSLLRFTDSILLFLYSYWCQERSCDRLRPELYHSSDLFRADIRGQWEREYRKEDLSAKEKEKIGCMVGLAHLIEAMVANHLSHSQGTQVQRQHRDISIAASLASASTPKSGADKAPIPSMIGPSPNYISPPGQQDRSPSNNSNEGAMELVNLANELAGTMSAAANHLHNSRSRLSPVLMRDHFPRMFVNAITSDFSAEALPAPGDMLGSGKTVSPDNTDHFAWPIELGMSAGIAHLVAFGRGMVKEYAETSGREWQLKLD